MCSVEGARPRFFGLVLQYLPVRLSILRLHTSGQGSESLLSGEIEFSRVPFVYFDLPSLEKVGEAELIPRSWPTEMALGVEPDLEFDQEWHAPPLPEVCWRLECWKDDLTWADGRVLLVSLDELPSNR